MSALHPNHPKPSTARRRVTKISQVLKACLWSGPLMILTGRITPRHAVFIIAAVVPAILCMVLLVVPGFLFCTPEHQAYFYFGRAMSNDPISLLPMAMAALCALAALPVPSAVSRPVFQRSMFQRLR